MESIRRIPLTALGWFALALGIVCFIAGWLLGWLELTVLATGCALALLIALPFVLGRLRLEIERGLERDRITVGETGRAIFRFENRGTRSTRRRSLLDRFDGGSDERRGTQLVGVPALPAGGHGESSYQLPQFRRGRYDLGPAVISRADPLRILERNDARTEVSTLWVHPRTTRVEALPVGFAKDLEGPTTETSPAGDVAFHSLREYEFGDDFRHIHWLSTARAREPMVRHYVDNRRPYVSVLLDNRSTVFTPDTFELAVEITASLVESAFAHREPIAVWANDEVLLGRSAPGDRDTAMDRLATVATVDADERHDPMVTGSTMTRSEPGISAAALVTGAVSSTSLLPVVRNLRRRVRVIVIRVWQPGDIQREPVPGAAVIDVANIDQFAAGWRGVAS